MKSPRATGRSGWVYFMTDGTEIKVGWSGNPEQRRGNVQQERGRPVSIVTTFPGTEADEGVIKATLAHICTGGEWFRDGRETRDLMDLLHKWRRYIGGGTLTIADVLNDRIGDALRKNPLTRIMPCEFDGYAAWYAENKGKLPTPQIERQALFCSLDLQMLRRDGRHEVVQRIVARSFATLATMMGRVSVVSG